MKHAKNSKNIIQCCSLTGCDINTVSNVYRHSYF